MALRSILVAYDGTEASVPALEEAGEIAKTNGAKVTIVAAIPLMAGAMGIAIPPGSTVVATLEEARHELADAKARLEARGLRDVEVELLEGDPVVRILAYAELHHPDLIVVGSRRRSGAGRFLLGSVSDGILHHASASVLLVKGRPAAPRR